MAVLKCENNLFVLRTKNTDYALCIDKNGYNRHIYWGKKCRAEDYFVLCTGDENSNHTKLDEYKQEITPFGGTMYRDCDMKAVFNDGCREIDLEFVKSKADDNRLTLVFKDKFYPLTVKVNYETFDDSDIMKRFVTVENNGSDNIVFERLYSAQFNLPSVKPYTFQNTNGACEHP